MFIANPKHVDIAIKHLRQETKKNINQRFQLNKGIKQTSQTTSQKTSRT